MITVSIIKENKDGSADANVRFDKEGLQILIQWGIVAILKEVKDAYCVPIKGRKPRTDADSGKKRGSPAVAKAKTRVASKSRKTTKA